MGGKGERNKAEWRSRKTVKEREKGNEGLEPRLSVHTGFYNELRNTGEILGLQLECTHL